MSDTFDPDRETDRAVVIDDPRTLVCESPDAVRLIQDSGGFVPEAVDIPRADLPRVIEHLEAALDEDGEGVLIPDGGDYMGTKGDNACRQTESAMSDSETLFEALIKRKASPDDLHSFCELLEEGGYDIQTNLSNGRIRIRSGGEDE